jgi:hypothetical protein
MQASPRKGSGTWVRNDSVKVALMHQQGGCASPVSRSISIAHALAVPQIGQCVASTSTATAFPAMAVVG